MKSAEALFLPFAAHSALNKFPAWIYSFFSINIGFATGTNWIVLFAHLFGFNLLCISLFTTVFRMRVLFFGVFDAKNKIDAGWYESWVKATLKWNRISSPCDGNAKGDTIGAALWKRHLFRWSNKSQRSNRHTNLERLRHTDSKWQLSAFASVS